MIKSMYILIIITVCFCFACSNKQNSHGHTHDTVEQNTDHHGHDHEAHILSYTLYSDGYELFVEFPVLIVGQLCSFNTRITHLNNYKPVKRAELTASLIKGNRGIRHTADSAYKTGIFRPALQPKEPGAYILQFDLLVKNKAITFKVPEIHVFDNREEALSAKHHEVSDDEIYFSKEQAWKTDFASVTVLHQPFYTVIHTSAKVLPHPDSYEMLNAQAEGKVNLLVTEGQSVNKGDLLAILSSSGLESNISTKLNERKIAFEKSKADYLRTKPLALKQVVSQKDFLQIEAKYKQDSLKYFLLANSISQAGLKITAPQNGFINNIYVSNGQFVNAGTILFSLNNSEKFLIKAFVNQSDFQKVNGIYDANFSLGDANAVIPLSELDGEIISNTAFVKDNNTRIPVVFVANSAQNLLPGGYLEAYLKTGFKEKALVIPLSAIIEEQGYYFVYVQTAGESYLKRKVALANNDGEFAEVISGLRTGERIVTKGAYQIKLASMSGDLPVHGHAH